MHTPGGLTVHRSLVDPQEVGVPAGLLETGIDGFLGVHALAVSAEPVASEHVHEVLHHLHVLQRPLLQAFFGIDCVESDDVRRT